MSETIDRLRRIETMLCRHIAGKPDQKTQLRCEAWHTGDGVEVEINSMSISLQAVIDAARAAGCGGEDFLVCDNGKPRLSIREITN